MRVWIVKTSESLPIDGADVRLERAGLLADTLSQRGADVTWWTSTFHHVERRQRFTRDTVVDMGSNYRIRLLHSPSYRKNVSVARAHAEWAIGRRFAESAEREDRPDVILCCMPSLDLAKAATSYGLCHDVPVVIDIRDLWPDVFIERLPRSLRPAAPVLFSMHYKMLRSACKRAAGISGITPEFVAWGLKHAGRSRSEFDRDFPLGYPDIRAEPGGFAKALKFWSGLEVGRDSVVVCYLGSFGQRNCEEFEALIDSARVVSDEPRIKFVLCGDGVNLDRYKARAAGARNVLFPGWVGFSEARALMHLSSIGIIPYQSTADFMMSIPNKAIEYMSAGLPIVSSVAGKLQSILSANDCGITYPNRSVTELATIFRQIQQDRERLNTMGGNARRLYEARFVASSVYGSMAEYLEQVAGHRGAGPSGALSGDGRLIPTGASLS